MNFNPATGNSSGPRRGRQPFHQRDAFFNQRGNRSMSQEQVFGSSSAWSPCGPESSTFFQSPNPFFPTGFSPFSPFSVPPSAPSVGTPPHPFSVLSQCFFKQDVRPEQNFCPFPSFPAFPVWNAPVAFNQQVWSHVNFMQYSSDRRSQWSEPHFQENSFHSATHFQQQQQQRSFPPGRNETPSAHQLQLPQRRSEAPSAHQQQQPANSFYGQYGPSRNNNIFPGPAQVATTAAYCQSQVFHHNMPQPMSFPLGYFDNNNRSNNGMPAADGPWHRSMQENAQQLPGMLAALQNAWLQEQQQQHLRRNSANNPEWPGSDSNGHNHCSPVWDIDYRQESHELRHPDREQEVSSGETQTENSSAGSQSNFGTNQKTHASSADSTYERASGRRTPENIPIPDTPASPDKEPEDSPRRRKRINTRSSPVIIPAKRCKIPENAVTNNASETKSGEKDHIMIRLPVPTSPAQSKTQGSYKAELSSATSIVLRRNQPGAARPPGRPSKKRRKKRGGPGRPKGALTGSKITRARKSKLGMGRRRRSTHKRTPIVPKKKQAPPKPAADVVGVVRKRGRPRKYPLPPAAAVENEENITNIPSSPATSDKVEQKCDDENVATLETTPEHQAEKVNEQAPVVPTTPSTPVTLQSVHESHDSVPEDQDVVRFVSLSELSETNLDSPPEIDIHTAEEILPASQTEREKFIDKIGLKFREIDPNKPNDITTDTVRYIAQVQLNTEEPISSPVEKPWPVKLSPTKGPTSDALAPSTHPQVTTGKRRGKRVKILSQQLSKRRKVKQRAAVEAGRQIVYSTQASERELLRIPERTLRLRARQGGNSAVDYAAATRRWKSKWDGPLFPKIPITAAEKKLEKIALAKMESWELNDQIGETYLHRAAGQGEREVALYCLKFGGVHPRCTNDRGYTPLHEACKGGSLEVAKLLLDHNAYHSQPARGNIRPLHVACRAGQLELVRLLLSEGADPKLVTLGGTDCFDLAESHPPVYNYLQDYAAGEHSDY